MKIDFNPHAAAQAQSARGPQAQTTPPAPEGSDDGVEITLSQAAQQILKTGDADYDGKSPGHMARQFIANSLATAAAEDGEAPNFSSPFGQIVKTFAPGHNKESEVVEEPDAVPEDGGETAPVDETADTGDTGDTTGTTEGDGTTVADGSDGTGDTGTADGDDTTVADGSDGSGDTGTTEGDDTTVVAAPEEGDGSGIGETDPAIVVEEPDITELLDDSAPTDGETTETGSDMAGSGDAVASTGDTGDTTGTTETGEPVAVVDTGDVTDELLDQLDENSEEVV